MNFHGKRPNLTYFSNGLKVIFSKKFIFYVLYVESYFITKSININAQNNKQQIPNTKQQIAKQNKLIIDINIIKQIYQTSWHQTNIFKTKHQLNSKIISYQYTIISDLIIISQLAYKVWIMSAPNEYFKYPQCQKGEFHVGQIANLVCIESSCIEKSLLCGICLEDQHKNHKVRPFKVVVQNSKKYIEGIKPIKSEQIDEIKATLIQSKKKIMIRIDEFEKYLKDRIQMIRCSVNSVYDIVKEQIEMKTGSIEQLLKEIEQLKMKEIQYDKIVLLMYKLLAGVPQQGKKEQKQLTGKDILQTLGNLQTKTLKDFQKIENKAKKQFDTYHQVMKKSIKNLSIYNDKNQYKFSPDLHHTGVQIVNDNLIKSTEAYNYHFALMEPSLQSKGNNKPQTLSFKIKENISNWLAVGVCYKNMAQSNNFNFNYSQLGHGAYMISSNAGSWSSIDSSKNNVVTGFNFYKDDIILVKYDPINSQIIFNKKNSQQSHTIEYEVKTDDELHLCGLFYYLNDEIQYLGYDE